MTLIGSYFWSIASYIESGQDASRPPWHGRVTKEYFRHDGSISHVRLCRYSGEDETPNEDPNCSAYVNTVDLFADFESARKAFFVYLKERVEVFQEAIKRVETLKEGEFLLW